MSETHSFWSKDITLPSLPPIHEDLQCDVAIVGAGIAGLTTAYLLLKQGKSVVILDKDGLAGGQTSRTTAHLTNFLDDRFTELERVFGTDGLKDAIESHGQSVDLIEKIIKEEGIACDFERLDGYLFRWEGDFSSILEEELQAGKRAHIEGLQLGHLPITTIRQNALKMPGQAQFHPLKYILGLTEAIRKRGGKIYSHAHVTSVKGGSPCTIVTSESYKIMCDSAVVATHVPIHSRFVMHTKQAAYRTYAFAAVVEKNSVPKGLYYDTADPYHYIRIYEEKERDILIIGGEDHKTGQEKHPLDRFERLELWAAQYFSYQKIVARWSGQIMEPVDSLAFLGEDPLEKNVYLITGDSGNGLTHATVGANIISCAIQGNPSPYAYLYEPKRKSLMTAATFAKENLNVAEQYVEWLLPEKEISVEALQPDAGVVVQNKGKKIAVYKDKKGEVHEMSAICPHLGCIVNWNEAEKSWDCPCHGSRFSCKGEVLDGPAIHPLEPARKTIKT